jgi:uncharacterized protein YndB with AHSA1/START domain
MPALEAAPAHSTVPTFMLTQTRVIRAPRQRVFEAWITPEILMQWFGSAGKHCPSAEVDLRVGGAYRIEMEPTSLEPDAGPDATCASQRVAAFGNYTRIVPNELLQFTWSSDWNPGEESLVTVSVKDVAAGTEINILHENFNTEASRDGHNKGWAGCLDKLAHMLES